MVAEIAVITAGVAGVEELEVDLTEEQMKERQIVVCLTLLL